MVGYWARSTGQRRSSPKIEIVQRILNWKLQNFYVIFATKFAVSVPNFRTLSPELEEIEPFQTEVVGYWATYYIHEKKLQYLGK